MHACMHSGPSIERPPQFGFLTRSSISIRAARMAFSSSLEFGYVVLGLFFFPSPTRFRPDKYAYDGRQKQTPIVDLTSHCPPGTMSSVLFAKHVNFEHSVSSPLPVITSRREHNVNYKTNLFWPCRGFLLVADRGVLQLPSSAALIFRSCPSQRTWKCPRTFAWIDYRVERHWFFPDMLVRTETWRGKTEISAGVNFSPLSQQYAGTCKHGTQRQVTQVRETRAQG